jgi:hypothetical protein
MTSASPSPASLVQLWRLRYRCSAASRGVVSDVGVLFDGKSEANMEPVPAVEGAQVDGKSASGGGDWHRRVKLLEPVRASSGTQGVKHRECSALLHVQLVPFTAQTLSMSSDSGRRDSGW